MSAYISIITTSPDVPMASDEAADFDLGDRVRTKGLVNAAQHNGKMAVVIALG